MKNRRFLLAVMAILTVFAMIGCQNPGNPGDGPVTETVTVTFNPEYEGAQPLKFDIKKNEALGAKNYAKVQELEDRGEDYDFKGWSLSKNGDPVEMTADSKWSVDTDYYGLWEDIIPIGEPITISYNLNGLPGEQPANYTGAKSGEAIGEDALPVVTPTDDTYDFLGWSETTNGEILTADAVFRSNTTFYARYTQTITITYDLNGFPGTQPSSKTVKAGHAIGADALPVLESNDPDYTFMGWSDTATGDILDGTEIFHTDTTLYARWGGTITVTYDLNGFSLASGKPVDKKIAAGTPIGAATIPAMYLYGYTWLGWSETPDGHIVTEHITFNASITLYARFVVTQGPIQPPPMLTFDIPYDLHPLRASIPSDWIRGADISNCWEIEQYGGKYKNFDGYVEDIMKILTDNGINYVRIRLWVDPTKHPEHYPGDGNNNITVTKAIAARAKAAGMKFLLGYHYSDYWADPGKQQVPYAWKNAATTQALIDLLADYTTETLAEFIEAGAKPDMVQLGNEIPGGILNSDPAGATAATKLNGWPQYSQALQAAAVAVRKIDNPNYDTDPNFTPSMKIMIQMDAGGDSNRLTSFGNFTKRKDTGAAPPAANTEVDYDVIGLSWYPFWNTHGTIDALYTNIRDFKTRFDKEVVICESGYMFNTLDVDYPPSSNGVNVTFNEATLGNVMGEGQETSSAASMTNTNRFTSDSGVQFGTRANGTTQYLPATPENQARVYRAFMDAVAAAGGDGVMWWGADWFAPVYGLSSNVENGALFDNEGKALPAMRVLGGIKSANTEKPGKITSFKAAVTFNSAVITWDAVNSAIANTYELERAPAASGPWTTLKDDITGVTYTDSTGLSPGNTYYYQARAFNATWGAFCDPIAANTQPLPTPTSFRVTDTTVDSVTLKWNSLGASYSYNVYGAQSTTEPVASAYNLLGTIAAGTTAFTHSSLTAADTWWYTISAVHSVHGEGAKSAAVSAVVQAAPNYKSTVNMSNAVVDDDLKDASKASSSTDYLISKKSDNAINDEIKALYVANDATNLYVVLEYTDRPSLWGNYYITVWIDNTNSSVGGASTGSSATNNRYRIAENQSIIPAATIEATISHNQNTVSMSSATSGTAPAKNATWAANGPSSTWAAPAGQTVVKYSIPLARIAAASKGDELRIVAAHVLNWTGEKPVIGGLVPISAATDPSPGSLYISPSVTIDMGRALLYTVK